MAKANWNSDGAFLMFKDSGEIKQISHTDNGVIWFTDNSTIYPYEYRLVKPINLKQISKIIGKLMQIKKLCR